MFIIAKPSQLLNYQNMNLFSTFSHWPIRPSLFLGLRFVLAAYTFCYLVVEMTPLTEWQVVVTNQTVVCGGATAAPTVGPQVGLTRDEIVTHNVTISGLTKFSFFTVWSYTVMVVHFTVAFVLSVLFYHDNSESDTHSVMATTYDDGDKSSGDNVFDNEAFAGQKSNAYNVDRGHVNSYSYDLNDDKTNITRWYFKVSWVLASVIMIAAPVVTTVFFTSIYKGGASIDFGDTNVHLLNLVFVVVDFGISARPVRLLHSYLPFVYASLYLVFTVIYWCVTGDHVYDILNLDCPVIFIIWTFALVLALPCLQLFYFGLYKLKVYLLQLIDG